MLSFCEQPHLFIELEANKVNQATSLCVELVAPAKDWCRKLVPQI